MYEKVCVRLLVLKLIMCRFTNPIWTHQFCVLKKKWWRKMDDGLTWDLYIWWWWAMDADDGDYNVNWLMLIGAVDVDSDEEARSGDRI